MASGHRKYIGFRMVNRPGAPGYRPFMQRHHLLPRQLLGTTCFAPLFATLGCESIGFDDFRTNGLLLPASAEAALETGLPLHRGPHRNYNQMVAERVGQIEAGWRRSGLRNPSLARDEALVRLALLQNGLRRQLLQREGRLATLSRKDPFRAGLDFTELDALAEMLWTEMMPQT
ncbi:MAG: AHH domain-containing protein [Erythrobacter sp.]|nr:MAG: AHH domain-containing protein [Erythrobacter sp.]